MVESSDPALDTAFAAEAGEKENPDEAGASVEIAGAAAVAEVEKGDLVVAAVVMLDLEKAVAVVVVDGVNSDLVEVAIGAAAMIVGAAAKTLEAPPPPLVKNPAPGRAVAAAVVVAMPGGGGIPKRPPGLVWSSSRTIMRRQDEINREK